MSPRFCGEFQYSPLKTALYIEKNLLPAQLKAIPSVILNVQLRVNPYICSIA
jgi:hypothetical protein